MTILLIENTMTPLFWQLNLAVFQGKVSMASDQITLQTFYKPDKCHDSFFTRIRSM